MERGRHEKVNEQGRERVDEEKIEQNQGRKIGLQREERQRQRKTVGNGSLSAINRSVSCWREERTDNQ